MQHHSWSRLRPGPPACAGPRRAACRSAVPPPDEHASPPTGCAGSVATAGGRRCARTVLFALGLALAALVALPVAARSAPVDTAVATFQPPVAGPVVVRHPFEAPSSEWGPGHRGVDLAAGAGAAVLAPADGIVTFAAQVAGRPVLVLTHRDGLRSSLEPVQAQVPVGSTVLAGQVVGVLLDSPASHCAPDPCLHWGVRDGTTYLDPMALLRSSGPMVLLSEPAGQLTRSASRIW